jgi:hypothetical protein
VIAFNDMRIAYIIKKLKLYSLRRKFIFSTKRTRAVKRHCAPVILDVEHSPSNLKSHIYATGINSFPHSFRIDITI